jgi:hypothetical protein
MRQNSSGVLEEFQRQKSAPPIPGKPTAKWSFVAGILIVLAIALVGFALRSSRIRSAHRSTLADSEMAVSVVHPQKTSITIPVIAGNSGDLTIPAGTLLLVSGQPAVGVVRPDGRVEVRKITISRDLGSILEISKGLSESDQIVTSPPPGLSDGTPVTIANPA